MNIIRLNSIGEPFAKSGQATPPSGDSNDEYLDLSNMSNEAGITILRMSALAKATATASGMTATIITPPYQLESMGSSIPIAAKINLKNKVLVPTGTDASGTIVTTTMTLVEWLASSFNTSIEFFNSIPRITKEQFYTL